MQNIDTVSDMAFLAYSYRFAAMVDRTVEQTLESETKGDGTGAGHAGTNDLDLLRGVGGMGGLLAHYDFKGRWWTERMSVIDDEGIADDNQCSTTLDSRSIVSTGEGLLNRTSLVSLRCVQYLSLYY